MLSTNTSFPRLSRADTDAPTAPPETKPDTPTTPSAPPAKPQRDPSEKPCGEPGESPCKFEAPNSEPRRQNIKNLSQSA